MAGIKIVDLPPLGRDLASTDLLELSLAGGTGSRKITGQEIMNTSKLNIGTTAITSGTVGRVLFQGTGNVVQESANLFWDNTNGRLGIGTSTPLRAIDVFASFPEIATRIAGNGTGKFSFLGNAGGEIGAISLTGSSGEMRMFTSNSYFPTFYSSGSEAMRIATTRNVLINTITDAGFRLDVNGTARVQTSLEIAGATGVTLGGGASALAYSGNVLNIGNSASWTDIRLFAGGVQKFSQTSSLTTIANTTINLSTATVQLAGVNALTYSGTDIRIGSVAAGFNSLSMYVAGSERARIASTGNVLINTTTDAGFKLDVNGTARFNNSVIAQTVSSVNVLDVSNIRIADDGNGRYIQAVNGFTLRATATPTTNFITLSSNSANNWKTTQTIGLSPSGGNGGVLFSSTATAGPSNSIMTFVRQRNDSGKSAIINTEDFASSGNVPINMFIYSGKETVLNNQANLILCHDGTIARGNTLIGTATNVASAIVNVESTTQGFLPPRMTQTQRNAIASPAIGLEIYQTDATEGKYIYKSSGWTYIG